MCACNVLINKNLPRPKESRKERVSLIEQLYMVFFPSDGLFLSLQWIKHKKDLSTNLFISLCIQKWIQINTMN